MKQCDIEPGIGYIEYRKILKIKIPVRVQRQPTEIQKLLVRLDGSAFIWHSDAIFVNYLIFPRHI